MSRIVQYIIVSGELTRKLKWSLGSVIAKCCQASTSVLETYRDDFDSRKYLRDINIMERVVVEVKTHFYIRLMQCGLHRFQISKFFVIGSR